MRDLDPGLGWLKVKVVTQGVLSGDIGSHSHFDSHSLGETGQAVEVAWEIVRRHLAVADAESSVNAARPGKTYVPGSGSF